jgi:hypothetical protein
MVCPLTGFNRRHQVEDISFGPILAVVPEAEPEPSPPVAASPPRTTPNTSAKRKRLQSDSVRSRAVPRSGASQARSYVDPLGNPDPYEFREEATLDSVQKSLASSATRRQIGLENDPDSIESLPEPSSHRSSSRRSARITNEVQESPYEKSGSDHRRTVPFGSVANSASILQDALGVGGEEDSGPLSSPLVGKARRRKVGPRTSSESIAKSSSHATRRRSSRLAEIDGVDELSPNNMADSSNLFVQISPALPVVQERQHPANEEEPETQADESQAQADDAEEIDIHEAVRKLGRKRRRQGLDEPEDGVPEHAAQPSSEPKQKRRRRRAELGSPAKQKQGKLMTKAKVKPTSKPTGSKPRDQEQNVRGKAKEAPDVEDDVDGAIPITVQRFTKKVHYAEGESDTDILHSDIPYSSRGGVNTIDVLSQMCEEVIESSLNTLQNGVQAVADSSTRKEYRIKLRALEAFQEELRTRFLQHVRRPPLYKEFIGGWTN